MRDSVEPVMMPEIRSIYLRKKELPERGKDVKQT